MRLFTAPFLLLLSQLLPAQVQVGFRGGMNKATINGVEDHFHRLYERSDGEITPNKGYQVGVIGRLTVLKHFYLQSELNLLTKGYRYSIIQQSGVYSQTTVVTPGGQVGVTKTYCHTCPLVETEVAYFRLKTRYVEIPLLLGVSFGIGEGEAEMHLNGGPYLGYWLSGRVKSEGFGIEPYDYRFSDAYDRRWETGVHLGVMLSHPLKNGDIFLDLRGSFGLTDMRRIENLTYDKTALQKNYNQALQISAGYLFGKTTE